jgi:hypothetical protein
MKILRISLLLIALLLLTGCQPRKTGIFSSLDMDKTGLVFGYEIFILKGDRANGRESDYYALVQCANGSISPPIFGQVEMAADQVTITIKEQGAPRCPASKFTGIIGFKELTGDFGNGKELTLPRKDSFWQ